jgi:putative nucleotidyltransferase with HDIG domain
MDYKQEFYNEVSKIQDENILRFTKFILSKADPLFWTSPCSSSGKFHPPEDQGKSGLLRHLIKASYVAEQFARRAMFSQYELDTARSATLLHDICKNGNPWGKNTDYQHGIIGANFINQFSFPNKITKEIITNGIRYHMSPWNTTLPPEKYFLLNKKGGEPEEGIIITPEDIRKELEEVKRGLTPHSIIEKCVQEADYWASRNEMSFMPGVSVNLEKRHDSPNPAQSL